MKKPEYPIEVKAGSSRVKIYRVIDPLRTRYTLAYHEGAERKLRQFTDEGKARREAKTIAEKLNAGQGAALELTGADRDSYLAAVSKLKPLQVPLNVAVEEYVKARGFKVPLVEAAKSYAEAHSARLPHKSVSDVVKELFVAKKTDGASVAYLGALKTYLNRFAGDFKANIASVQTAEIDAWLRKLKMSARSRNNFRNSIILLFNFAKAAGYLNRDRTTAAAHVAVARRQIKSIEVFSPQDFTKLLATADDAVLPFFVLGGLCGLRTQEVVRLNWEDIHWPEASIVISAAIAKTRTRRLAPLTDPAAVWLSKWKKKTGKVIKVERLRLHERVKIIAGVAGVTWKHNGLRHSFITYRMATSKDFVRTAFEAGNSPGIIKANYDAVATEQEGKLWFSIIPDTADNVVKMEAAA